MWKAIKNKWFQFHQGSLQNNLQQIIATSDCMCAGWSDFLCFFLDVWVESKVGLK